MRNFFVLKFDFRKRFFIAFRKSGRCILSVVFIAAFFKRYIAVGIVRYILLHHILGRSVSEQVFIACAGGNSVLKELRLVFEIGFREPEFYIFTFFKAFFIETGLEIKFCKSQSPDIDIIKFSYLLEAFDQIIIGLIGNLADSVLEDIDVNIGIVHGYEFS